METKNDLVIEYLPLAHKLTKKHRPQFMGQTFHERLSDAFSGLMTAAASWDESKGSKFVSYAWRGIENHIRNSRRCKRKPLPKLLGEYDMIVQDHRTVPVHHAIEADEFWGIVRETLPKRQYFVLSAKFRCGHTSELIGRFLGVSRQRVDQIRFQAIRGLKKNAKFLKYIGANEDFSTPSTCLMGISAKYLHASKRDTRNPILDPRDR